MTSSLSDFAARLRMFMAQSIAEADGGPFAASTSHDGIFDELAIALFTLQFAHNGAYRKFCEFRGVTPQKIAHWSEIPAMPTSAFKELDITSLPVKERNVVFQSSGTTSLNPSRHFHSAESLGLYEASLLSWFNRHLIADTQELAMLSLTPPGAAAPHSSLVHMFETIRTAQAPTKSLFAGRVEPDGSWTVNLPAVVDFFRNATATAQPVLLVGTAFNFVHLLDYFIEHDLKLALPSASRILETGGYKGRSRVISKTDLYNLLTGCLAVPLSHIVSEYGMSELSSQAYDGFISRSGPRLLRFPPWARVQIISAETGQPLVQGQTGLIRVFDLANVWSVMAIQTEDLGVQNETGFELIGRAEAVEPRGCSLMASDR